MTARILSSERRRCQPRSWCVARLWCSVAKILVLIVAGFLFLLWAIDNLFSCACGAWLDEMVSIGGRRSHFERWSSLGGPFARFTPYVTAREWCSVCMGRLDPCFGQRRLTLHPSSFKVNEQFLHCPSNGFPLLRTYGEGIRLSHRPSFVLCCPFGCVTS